MNGQKYLVIDKGQIGDTHGHTFLHDIHARVMPHQSQSKDTG